MTIPRHILTVLWSDIPRLASDFVKVLQPHIPAREAGADQRGLVWGERARRGRVPLEEMLYA